MRSFRLRMLVLAVLTSALVFVPAPPAFSATWSDTPDDLLAGYGLTTADLSQISQGYPDGTWQPWRNVTPAQFVKMASAAGLDLDPADLSDPFSLGLTPETVTRERAAAAFARSLADAEGYDLAGMTEEDIAAALANFADSGTITLTLRARIAFAVERGILKGNAAGLLAPQAVMSRIAAAALITRALAAGPQLTLDQDDDGSTITVKAGDTIQVVLEGNPTTGYTWTAALSEEDASILQQIGEPAYETGGGIGAGGVYTFRFKALAAGEATLKLVYAQPWSSALPEETFTVTVKVLEAPLEGTSWTLEGWSLSSLDPRDFEMTATFDRSHMSGKAAVNGYSAIYVTGRNGSFSVGGIMSTLIGGSEQAMAAEAAYFELLRHARAYRLSNGGLILYDGNGNESLLFSAAP